VGCNPQCRWNVIYHFKHPVAKFIGDKKQKGLCCKKWLLLLFHYNSELDCTATNQALLSSPLHWGTIPFHKDEIHKTTYAKFETFSNIIIFNMINIKYLDVKKRDKKYMNWLPLICQVATLPWHSHRLYWLLN